MWRLNLSLLQISVLFLVRSTVGYTIIIPMPVYQNKSVIQSELQYQDEIERYYQFEHAY